VEETRPASKVVEHAAAQIAAMPFAAPSLQPGVAGFERWFRHYLPEKLRILPNAATNLAKSKNLPP